MDYTRAFFAYGLFFLFLIGAGLFFVAPSTSILVNIVKTGIPHADDKEVKWKKAGDVSKTG
jgi:hypothetical protein